MFASERHDIRFQPSDCTACWFSCRGEAEAPLTLGRIIEVNR